MPVEPFPSLNIMPPGRRAIPMGRRFVVHAVIGYWLRAGWHRADGVRKSYKSVTLRRTPDAPAMEMLPRQSE